MNYVNFSPMKRRLVFSDGSLGARNGLLGPLEEAHSIVLTIGMGSSQAIPLMVPILVVTSTYPCSTSGTPGIAWRSPFTTVGGRTVNLITSTAIGGTIE
jgi:hypothetical protein